MVADESILSSQNQHGSVDQFQCELFVLTWQKSDSKMIETHQRFRQKSSEAGLEGRGRERMSRRERRRRPTFKTVSYLWNH